MLSCSVYNRSVIDSHDACMYVVSVTEWSLCNGKQYYLCTPEALFYTRSGTSYSKSDGKLLLWNSDTYRHELCDFCLLWVLLCSVVHIFRSRKSWNWENKPIACHIFDLCVIVYCQTWFSLLFHICLTVQLDVKYVTLCRMVRKTVRLCLTLWRRNILWR